MSAITVFEDFFKKLSNEEKRELIEHVLKKYLQPVNEGFYGGPSGLLQKGLYAGPSGTNNSQRCPVCGK